MSNNLLAQVPQPIGNIGEGEGFGPFNFKGVGNPIAIIATIVSVIIGFITVAAGIYFMFQFFIGGFGWLASSGDKSRLQAAQDRLSHSLIGLIVVVAAYAIMSIIQAVTGLKFLDLGGLMGVLQF